ncbi:MAG TPA: GlsB/YeaQ/YmgE family stress response membrane protein [Candidatus Limnocylindrales bacterium]|nr:GlsB/YeaQ/YmgE family stress response membrane protein [Candidatus Limnocylindrales bacterium]
MGLIAWIVLGAIAGAIGNYAVKGGFGLIGTVILGIVGAVVGGFIFDRLFGTGDISSINYWSLLAAVFGSIIVIGFLKVVMGRGSDA